MKSGNRGINDFLPVRVIKVGLLPLYIMSSPLAIML